MLNEKKASTYFPGMYIVYDYDEPESGDINDIQDAKEKARLNIVDRVRKAVTDLGSTISFDPESAGEIATPGESITYQADGKEFTVSSVYRTLVRMIKKFDIPNSDRKKIQQIISTQIGMDKDPNDKKSKAKGFGSKGPEIRAAIVAAFEEVTEEDLLQIGSVKSFEDLKGPSTNFQKRVFDIAGGKQPAIGRGEIYAALMTGGKQGEDVGGAAVDVINGEETLNNKQIDKAAQGATNILKFVKELEKILNSDFKEQWPDFYNFVINDLSLVNIKTDKESGKSSALVPELKVEDVTSKVKELKDTYETFKNQLSHIHVIEALSYCFHIATSRELLQKAKPFKKNYVVLQRGYELEVIKIDKDKASLPVSSVGSSNRVKYKDNGFWNYYTDNYTIPNLETLKRPLNNAKDIIYDKSNWPGIINSRNFSLSKTGIQTLRSKLGDIGVFVDEMSDEDIKKAIELARKDLGTDLQGIVGEKELSVEEYIEWYKSLPADKKQYAPKVTESLPIYKLSLLEALDLE